MSHLGRVTRTSVPNKTGYLMFTFPVTRSRPYPGILCNVQRCKRERRDRDGTFFVQDRLDEYVSPTVCTSQFGPWWTSSPDGVDERLISIYSLL